MAGTPGSALANQLQRAVDAANAVQNGAHQEAQAVGPEPAPEPPAPEPPAPEPATESEGR